MKVIFNCELQGWRRQLPVPNVAGTSLAVGYVILKFAVVAAWFAAIKLSAIVSIQAGVEVTMEAHANVRLVMQAALREPGGEQNHSSAEAA
jgi:hypothetical protein